MVFFIGVIDLASLTGKFIDSSGSQVNGSATNPFELAEKINGMVEKFKG